MADVTHERIDAMPKATRARLGNGEEGGREVRGELRGLRGDRRTQQLRLTAVHTDIGDLHDADGAIDSRLARTERRLGIVNVPVT